MAVTNPSQGNSKVDEKSLTGRSQKNWRVFSVDDIAVLTIINSCRAALHNCECGCTIVCVLQWFAHVYRGDVRAEEIYGGKFFVSVATSNVFIPTVRVPKSTDCFTFILLTEDGQKLNLSSNILINKSTHTKQ